MNFQMCQQSPGKYLMLSGTATRFEFRDGQYGIYGIGSLQDQMGRVEDMFFASSDKSPLPQQSLLNVPCVYNVQWDANKQKFKAYFQSYANQQQTPNAYQQRQNAPQTPQQPAQGTNLPQGNGYYPQLLERIAKALEKIAENGQSFEDKYSIPPEGQGEGESAPF